MKRRTYLELKNDNIFSHPATLSRNPRNMISINWINFTGSCPWCAPIALCSGRRGWTGAARRRRRGAGLAALAGAGGGRSRDMRSRAASPRHREASVPASDAVGTALFSYLNSTLIKLVWFKIRCLLSTPFTQLFMVPFDILLFVIFFKSRLCRHNAARAAQNRARFFSILREVQTLKYFGLVCFMFIPFVGILSSRITMLLNCVAYPFSLEVKCSQ